MEAVGWSVVEVGRENFGVFVYDACLDTVVGGLAFLLFTR